MLEKLNDIDWAKISHAYGPATDVPDQLRALVSGNAEAWKKAVWDLHGNIWHQGTVYEASAHAVPLLLEIVRNGKLSDEQQIELLSLVALIGNGTSYLEVHNRPQSLSDSEFHTQLEREFGWVRAAQTAVAKGEDFYIDLLLSRHLPTRLLAAYLLGLSRVPGTEVVETLINGGVRVQ